MFPDVGAGVLHGLEPVPHGGLRRQRVGLRRDDDPDVDAAPGGGHDAPQDRVVGEVGADHVEAAAGAVDSVAERGPDGQVALARVVVEDLHLDAGGGLLDRGEEPVQPLGCRRQRAALEVPREQEHGLELGDDRALEAEHQVVRPGRVVVLDPGPADKADPAVDDHDLAMVEMAQVVEPPVDLAILERTIEIEECALVRDDLDAAVDERVVERLRPECRLAEGRFRDDPDADTGGGPLDQEVPELVADLAGLEPEDQDVDVRRRGGDVLEQPREERPAVDQQLPARRGRRLEVERQLAADRLPAEDGLDEPASTRRRDAWNRAAASPEGATDEDDRTGDDGAEEQDEACHLRKGSGPPVRTDRARQAQGRIGCRRPRSTATLCRDCATSPAWSGPWNRAMNPLSPTTTRP
jgi:hypothetical protein